MYKNYRLLYAPILACPVDGNIDSRVFSKTFYRTGITFRARTDAEAQKKADKFWKRGQFGMGKILVRPE